MAGSSSQPNIIEYIQQLGDLSKKNAVARDQFDQKYQPIAEKEKLSDIVSDQETYTKLFREDNTALSITELIQFSNNIAKRFEESMTKLHSGQEKDHTLGMSAHSIYPETRPQVSKYWDMVIETLTGRNPWDNKCFAKKEGQEGQEGQEAPEVCVDTLERITGESAGKRLVRLYLKCIDVLCNRYQFTIVCAKVDESRFRDGSASSCFRSLNPFIFECVSGNYSFTVSFIDDCDADIGLLRAMNLVNTKTGQTHPRFSCQLFMTSRNGKCIEDFLHFLRSDNLETHIDKRFNHIRQMIDSFEKEGYLVTTRKSEEYFTIGEIDIPLAFELEKGEKSCLLIPRQNDQVYVCVTLKQFASLNHYYTPDSIDYNSVQVLTEEFSRHMKYISVDDFAELKKLVDQFCVAWIEKQQVKTLKSLIMTHEHAYYKNGKKIHTEISEILGKGVTLKANIATVINYKYTDINYLQSNLYPVERNTITIHFRLEPVKLYVLTIENKYIDTTEFAKAYFSGGELPDISRYIHDLVPTITVEIPFDEMFGVLSKLMTHLSTVGIYPGSMITY
jgi:hypothetical protein